jgi:hypothetical protein
MEHAKGVASTDMRVFFNAPLRVLLKQSTQHQAEWLWRVQTARQAQQRRDMTAGDDGNSFQGGSAHVVTQQIVQSQPGTQQYHFFQQISYPMNLQIHQRSYGHGANSSGSSGDIKASEARLRNL